MTMRAWLALLAVALTIPSATAFHDDDAPLVARYSGDGDGWIAVRVQAHGAYTFEIIASQDGPWSADGLARDTGDGWITSYSYGTSGCGADLSLSARAGDQTVAHRLPYSCGSGTAGWGWGGSRDAVIVGWVAGDVDSWEFVLRGNATVTGVEQGAALDLRASDFERMAAADVDAGFARLRAGTDGQYPLKVEGLLFGMFDGSEAESSSADTPNGPRTCTCLFIGSPAGDYTLRSRGAATSMARVFTGADVRLPS